MQATVTRTATIEQIVDFVLDSYPVVVASRHGDCSGLCYNAAEVKSAIVTYYGWSFLRQSATVNAGEISAAGGRVVIPA